jgi:hypothetical protein
MIACKFCGFWNLEPTVFCTHCGRRIVQPKSRKLNWLLLIASVIDLGDSLSQGLVFPSKDRLSPRRD